MGPSRLSQLCLIVAGFCLAALAPGANSWAASLTTLYSFCPQTNCPDGAVPEWGVIQDADGNLFGATPLKGLNSGGTLFEITDSGFVSFFAGTPGRPSCRGQTVSALATSFGELAAASGALNDTGAEALQDAIEDFANREKRNATVRLSPAPLAQQCALISATLEACGLALDARTWMLRQLKPRRKQSSKAAA